MDVCEALRALLRGTPRPVIIRAATSLLLRTSSKRESAAAATLLWSIAYAPAATDTLLDLGVVQALLTTARKQEKDTAAYRAVLGALDSLILSPKVRTRRPWGFSKCRVGLFLFFHRASHGHAYCSRSSMRRPPPSS